MSLAELLFNRNDLSAVLLNQEQKTIQAIDAFDTNRMLNTSIDDLVEYFFEEKKLNR
jgi:hypothetical protein